MSWQEQLIQSVEEIIKHGWGEFKGHIQEREGDKISILITAGKSYRFLIKK